MSYVRHNKSYVRDKFFFLSMSPMGLRTHLLHNKEYFWSYDEKYHNIFFFFSNHKYLKLIKINISLRAFKLFKLSSMSCILQSIHLPGISWASRKSHRQGRPALPWPEAFLWPHRCHGDPVTLVTAQPPTPSARWVGCPGAWLSHPAAPPSLEGLAEGRKWNLIN